MNKEILAANHPCVYHCGCSGVEGRGSGKTRLFAADGCSSWDTLRDTRAGYSSRSDASLFWFFSAEQEPRERVCCLGAVWIQGYLAHKNPTPPHRATIGP